MSDPWVKTTQLWFNSTYGESLGTTVLDADGVAGWATMFALTRALQKELGLSVYADNFGAGTLAAATAFGDITATNPSPNAGPSNIIKIAQGALYCKGYNADNGFLSGMWNSTSQQAMRDLRTDLGIAAGAGTLTAKLFKHLLTMDASRLIAGGDSTIRQAQMAMNGRYLGRRDFYVVPTDGYFLRDTHRALLFAIQYEVGLEDGVANGNFGPTTKTRLSQQGNISVGSTDTSKFFVHLFTLALRVNGHQVPFSGTFSSSASSAVSAFQQFVALPQTGTANIQTWASLLISTGDPDRPGTGADCISTLTDARLTALRNAGYQYFGRYLTNTPDFSPDKCIKNGELARIFATGGRVFPLFQTGGGQIAHFTYARGEEVAEEAVNAAWAYRLPADTIIYFSVDFDALPAQVASAVVPYFQGLQQRIGRAGRNYRIGVYGPRDVCRGIVAAGLAVSSFVSDMSTGYAANIGQPMPSGWAFDQIQTLNVGTGAGLVEIDKNIVSGRDQGVASLAPQIGLGNDPLIPSSKLSAFEAEWFRACWEYPDALVQQGVMLANRDLVKQRVALHDEYITQLAAEFSCYKALIMTPLIWEGMVINPADAAADTAVSWYYEALQEGRAPTPQSRRDSSTGVCQIFAETAIGAINWAREWGLTTTRQYNVDVWQDMWAIHGSLRTDERFCIKVGMFVMMREVALRGVTPDNLRSLTPSEVIAMCYGYNGVNENAMIYGRRRAQLYYTIQRWHESFR